MFNCLWRKTLLANQLSAKDIRSGISISKLQNVDRSNPLMYNGLELVDMYIFLCNNFMLQVQTGLLNDLDHCSVHRCPLFAMYICCVYSFFMIGLSRKLTCSLRLCEYYLANTSTFAKEVV